MKIVNIEWGKPDMVALPFAYRLTHHHLGFGYLRITILHRQMLLTYQLARFTRKAVLKKQVG